MLTIHKFCFFLDFILEKSSMIYSYSNDDVKSLSILIWLRSNIIIYYYIIINIILYFIVTRQYTQ